MSSRRTLSLNLMSLLAFTAVAVAWAAFILYKGGGLPDFSEKYKVSTVLPSGAALAPGSRVTAAGVQVGKVSAVERQGAGAKVTLEIDDDEVTPLATDSRVQVRQRTPVGENYIAIVPGTSKTKVDSGDALAAGAADEFVDVDRVLSVLQGETRERARQTIRGLGSALDGRGKRLNQVVGRGADFLRDSGQLVDVLHRDRGAAARLVDQLGDVAAAVGQRDQAIRTLAERGLVSLGALADSDAALRRTIEELPASLRRIRRTSNTVHGVSAVATPVAYEAAAALDALQPAIRRLQPAADAGRGVMRQLGAAAPGLTQTLKQVTALSKPLPRALPKLHKSICEFAPIVRYAKPYFPEALHILVGLSSASNSYDATGHLIRLAPTFSENSISGLPDDVSLAALQLAHAGLMSPLGANLNYDPFPKPGTLGTTTATSTVPTGPEDIARRGSKYTRVTADC